MNSGNFFSGDPSGRDVKGVVLLPLVCWDCGFESRLRDGCLSRVNIMCYQVDVFATGWSLVQGTPTECQSVEIINKMQPCNRIYYSKIYWRLNMFRAAPHVYINQRLQIQLLMMSGMPLETCWAFHKLWNNKFHCKVAFCWLFLLNCHTAMHGSMNIKFINAYRGCIIECDHLQQ